MYFIYVWSTNVFCAILATTLTIDDLIIQQTYRRGLNDCSSNSLQGDTTHGHNYFQVSHNGRWQGRIQDLKRLSLNSQQLKYTA